MNIETEIRQLDNLIKEMSGLVERNLNYALDVYRNYDSLKQYELINDDLVNAYERWIETDCLTLLTKERLYAEDLRKVTGILSLVQDIERLGDHAKDILEFALRLGIKEDENEHILSLIDYVNKMVHDAIHSFINKDILLARDVINRDDHVDLEYDKLLQELITNESTNNKTNKNYTVFTALIVKYLERIADHSTNICEWVVYIVSGYYKDRQII